MSKEKEYCFDAVIRKNPDMDAAYIIFPYDVREEFGKMMVSGMNGGHAKLADWGMTHLKGISP